MYRKRLSWIATTSARFIFSLSHRAKPWERRGWSCIGEREDRTHGGVEKLSREGHRHEAFEASHRDGEKQDAQKIYLHAQVPVIGFYEAMAFQCVGPVFKEAGIPHRKMILVQR